MAWTNFRVAHKTPGTSGHQIRAEGVRSKWIVVGVLRSGGNASAARAVQLLSAVPVQFTSSCAKSETSESRRPSHYCRAK